MSYDTYAAKLDDQFRSFDYSTVLRKKQPENVKKIGKNFGKKKFRQISGLMPKRLRKHVMIRKIGQIFGFRKPS